VFNALAQIVVMDPDSVPMPRWCIKQSDHHGARHGASTSSASQTDTDDIRMPRWRWSTRPCCSAARCASSAARAPATPLQRERRG
jgi:hypothetical protein